MLLAGGHHRPCTVGGWLLWVETLAAPRRARGATSTSRIAGTKSRGKKLVGLLTHGEAHFRASGLGRSSGGPAPHLAAAPRGRAKRKRYGTPTKLCGRVTHHNQERAVIHAPPLSVPKHAGTRRMHFSMHPRLIRNAAGQHEILPAEEGVRQLDEVRCDSHSRPGARTTPQRPPPDRRPCPPQADVARRAKRALKRLRVFVEQHGEPQRL